MDKETDPPVRIISWNVAAWTTTVAKVREAYGKTSVSSASHGGLSTFMDLTGATLICLQETKVTHKRVMAEPFVCGATDSTRTGAAATPLAGWESYWSTSVKAPGFNGVCTYAKEGTTLFADPRPLRSDELDDEGRCLLTIHKHFAVFNIYAPYSRDSERHAFKKRFYAALLRAIARVRAEYTVEDPATMGAQMPMPVILLGDFNLVRRQKDLHWTKLGIPLDYLSFLEIDKHSEWWVDGNTPRHPVGSEADVKVLIQSKVVQTFENCEDPIQSHHRLLRLAPFLRPHIDMAVMTLASHIYNRYRDNSQVANELSPEHREALTSKPLTTAAAMKLIAMCPIISGEVCYDSQSLMTSNGLFDSLEKEAMSAAMQEIARAEMFVGLSTSGTNRSDWEAALSAAGLPAHSSPVVKPNTAICILVLLTGVCCSDPHMRRMVFGSLLREPYQYCASSASGADGIQVPPSTALPTLIDAVSNCYPDMSNSFTCWDQSRNGRYQNFGSRIDYILVDEALKRRTPHEACMFERWDTSLSPAYGGVGKPSPNPAELFSHASTMRSLTSAEGLYPQAPQTGEGMPPPTINCREAIFVPAHKMRSYAAYCGQHLASSTRISPVEFVAHVRSQFVEPLRTGSFCTPSQYSDHIGVVATFSGLRASHMHIPKKASALPAAASPLAGPVNVSLIASLEEREKLFPAQWEVTKGCMYRVPQQTIAAMFGRIANAKTVCDSKVPAAEAPVTKKPRVEVIDLD